MLSIERLFFTSDFDAPFSKMNQMKAGLIRDVILFCPSRMNVMTSFFLAPKNKLYKKKQKTVCIFSFFCATIL